MQINVKDNKYLTENLIDLLIDKMCRNLRRENQVHKLEILMCNLCLTDDNCFKNLITLSQYMSLLDWWDHPILYSHVEVVGLLLNSSLHVNLWSLNGANVFLTRCVLQSLLILPVDIWYHVFKPFYKIVSLKPVAMVPNLSLGCFRRIDRCIVRGAIYEPCGFERKQAAVPLPIPCLCMTTSLKKRGVTMTIHTST